MEINNFIFIYIYIRKKERNYFNVHEAKDNLWDKYSTISL